MAEFDLVVPFQYNQGLIILIFLLLILWGFGKLERMKEKKTREKMEADLENIGLP